LTILWGAIFALGGAGAVHAQKDSFYSGKTVRIVVGFTPGGFYDRWARLLARFMPLYIPGNPKFVVQNMPGGGSMIAANTHGYGTDDRRATSGPCQSRHESAPRRAEARQEDS
jgi:tripartite-type tricarboxylate transporter receptor subunit TctC